MSRSSKPCALKRFTKKLFSCCGQEHPPPLNPSWSHAYPCTGYIRPDPYDSYSVRVKSEKHKHYSILKDPVAAYASTPYGGAAGTMPPPPIDNKPRIPSPYKPPGHIPATHCDPVVTIPPLRDSDFCMSSPHQAPGYIPGAHGSPSATMSPLNDKDARIPSPYPASCHAPATYGEPAVPMPPLMDPNVGVGAHASSFPAPPALSQLASTAAPVFAFPITSNIDPKNIIDQLSKIPADSYRWQTDLGELAFTPHTNKKSLVGEASPVSQPCPNVCSLTAQLHLSRWLSYNPQSSTNPQIQWDVTCCPGNAFHLLDNDDFLQAMYSPATQPQMAELHIHFDPMGSVDFPWPYKPILEISRTDPIRVGDVLYAIYDYFRAQMTWAEVELIKKMSGGKYYRVLRKAFERRVARVSSEDLKKREYMGGLRRVDCLGSTTGFWGMWIGADSRVCLGLVG